MKNLIILYAINLFLTFQFSTCCSSHRDLKKQQGLKSLEDITPNNFWGNDTERIQAAIDSAKKTTNTIVIPKRNSNGSNIWEIDHSILLPSNMTVILDNCTIQLSNMSRDNMFRSDNVGIGITDPEWNYNISIIGRGDALLKGADNPRATGDAKGSLALLPKRKNNESYGSDAEKKEKQTSDWRSIMILIAYVDGFKLKNVEVEKAHSWAISFERTKHANISDVKIYNPEYITVNAKRVLTMNKDGIDLRYGCKYFRIDNVSGSTGDDFIALSSLDIGRYHKNGDINSYQVTSMKWRGPKDDIEQIHITNINAKTKYRGVAIRASDSASIHHVYINGLNTQKWNGHNNSILLGGSGYGKLSLPGKINNIYAMNIIGNGRSLIEIEAPIANCYFMNGIYRGNGDNVISYDIDQDKTKHVVLKNMIKVP